MRALLIICVAGAAALLLSGCPDIPGGALPGAKSDTAHSRAGPGAHDKVSEIAWFQGTLDEAFSRRGCADSHPRRTLFRF